MLKSLLLGVIGTAMVVGCESKPPAADPDRILHMAGEEAGQIKSPRERLTRQLNIANRETETGQPGNARSTLALARQTLEQADKAALNDQERLSGWISICELARNANDKPFANGALDQALAGLNGITPDPARCEFVPGIEREVRALRGDSAAAAMLRTAADWAMDLPDKSIRRSAYFVFAEELFNCSDYDGARGVLRHDQDAAWRSDALTDLSDRARLNTSQYHEPFAMVRAAASAPEKVEQSDATRQSATHFGKSLDFKSNYYRAKQE